MAKGINKQDLAQDDIRPTPARGRRQSEGPRQFVLARADPDVGLCADHEVIPGKNVSLYPSSARFPQMFRTCHRRVNGFSSRRLEELTSRACDSRVYEYLLPSYCLLPPASSDAICTLLNASSPGWRDGLGPGADFADQTPDMTESAGEGEALNPKERGEFERRRGWRIDQGTLERFRELVNEFHGSQYVNPSRYVW